MTPSEVLDDAPDDPEGPSPSADEGLDRSALEAFVRQENLHRQIVVTTAKDEQTSYVETIYTACGRAIPTSLTAWDDSVDDWCDQYRSRFSNASLLEVNLTTAIFVFDRTHKRVIVAYGVATAPARPRDTKRMRQFPDVNVGVTATMGDAAFSADRGHFLSHAAGGDLDINLFPQRRELNRGWSADGKRFRQMERYTAAYVGTFHYHGAEYDDLTWIPANLEYGVLREDRDWWVEQFRNK